ncbi:MAG: hypothetical protein ACRDK8_11595 [Solirubrobacteraceae bacterium]
MSRNAYAPTRLCQRMPLRVLVPREPTIGELLGVLVDTGTTDPPAA